MNLYQKLIKVRSSIGYQKKEAKGYGYNYVSEAQVFLAMNAEMNTQQIFLEQDMIKQEVVEMFVKTKKGWEQTKGLRIEFKYIITDCEKPEDKIERTQFIQNPGCDAQAMGSLCTYGMKYFIFKFFNIPMGDSEQHELDSLSTDEKESLNHIQKQKQKKKNNQNISHDENQVNNNNNNPKKKESNKLDPVQAHEEQRQKIIKDQNRKKFYSRHNFGVKGNHMAAYLQEIADEKSKNGEDVSFLDMVDDAIGYEERFLAAYKKEEPRFFALG